MGYGRWGPWYSWLGLPSRLLRQPVSAGCTRWPALVSDESALEACLQRCAIQIDDLLPLPFACRVCSSVKCWAAQAEWNTDVISASSCDGGTCNSPRSVTACRCCSCYWHESSTPTQQQSTSRCAHCQVVL